ncbi:MAG: signal peptide peptidase SppA [Clostridium sp.]|nr:signal peptide peptidase SppA [Bacteroides sp.]MCM1198848.1 signal peptide peptidase SppA [Clostridium sp.]
MKNFLKMTLATVLGFIIVSIVMSLFSFAVIGSLAALGDSKPAMPREAVLKIDMSEMVIAEQTKESDPFSSIQGNSTGSIGIWHAIQAINTAAEDPAIKFIYMKPDGVSGGMAEIEEFRNALKKFRASGKAIVSYTEAPANGSYYLASVSDKIFMSSYNGGMNMLNGFSSQITFLKDILDKLGVNVQLIRHGKYKSAGEMYIRNTISAENRTQYQVLLNSIWKSFSDEMAAARGMETEEFNSLVNDLKLNSPEDFLKYGLVDELLTNEELKTRLCALYGVDRIEDAKQISLKDYASIKVLPNYRAKEKIAIIYADGSIIDGSEKKEVSGDRFASIIADVRKDSTVKAVVFRVNSPGGSVVASDKIKTEVDLLKEVKPVIASYGNYAASGGYWISNNCDRIFANAGTLTGSIGVFSMIPDFSGTTRKVGVNVTSISSNAHGDMYSCMRPLDNAELAYMQASVDNIYDTFTSIVAEGRGLTQEYVDGIAQGRVWAGTDALEISLVDEIGGIEEAIRYAAGSVSENTDLSKWQIVEYPKPLTMIEQIMENFGGANASVFAGTPLEHVERIFSKWDGSKAGQVYARMPYEITIQ